MKKFLISLGIIVACFMVRAQATNPPYSASSLSNLVRLELPMQTNAMIAPTNFWNVFDAMIASEPWAVPNPRRYFWVHEDFLGGVAVGSYGWVGTPTGSGFGGAGIGDVDHVGIFELRTATATNSSYILSSHPSQIGITTNMTIRFRACVRVTPLSTGTDDYVAFIGFGDGAALADTDRLGFEYSDNLNTARWRLSARKASADSFGNSTVTVANNTWHYLAFDATATSITGTVDGVAITPITTNIPLVANKMGVYLKMVSTGRGAGTAAESMFVDYFQFLIEYGTNRQP